MDLIAVLAVADEASGGSSFETLVEAVRLPGAVIGGILSAGYSYTLIRASKPAMEKTRLESENLRLKNQQLRAELAADDALRTDPDSVVEEPPVGRSFLFAPTVESIVVRFVALELFARLFNAGSGSVVEGLSRFYSLSFFIPLGALANLVFWIFAAPLAFSIFRDVNRVLGISLIDLSMWRTESEARKPALRFLLVLVGFIVVPILLLLALAIALGEI